MDQRVRMFKMNIAARIIEVHHTIDDRTMRALRIAHNITYGIGQGIKETVHFRF